MLNINFTTFCDWVCYDVEDFGGWSLRLIFLGVQYVFTIFQSMPGWVRCISSNGSV